MRKTSVYLDEDEANGLRRVAARTGRSQAELIREGVRRIIEAEEDQPRDFHSMGVGDGGGQPYGKWSTDDLYDKVMGRR